MAEMDNPSKYLGNELTYLSKVLEGGSMVGDDGELGAWLRS